MLHTCAAIPAVVTPLLALITQAPQQTVLVSQIRVLCSLSMAGAHTYCGAYDLGLYVQGRACLLLLGSACPVAHSPAAL